jgi:SAM-dependent MidA family methyltransferase
MPEHFDDTLPGPDADAMAHSTRVVDIVLEEIAAAGGAIRFSRFMTIALYQPGLGYYSAGSRKFGEGGDFVTAPELSPLFSRCLARACAAVLGQYDDAQILEVGGGSGIMAADMLGELARLDCLPSRYRILEVSADLRDRQETTLASRLPEPGGQVEWLDDFPQEPVSGVILANEVLDALACERFRITSTGPQYLAVKKEGAGLGWTTLPADDELLNTIGTIESDLGWSLPVGYESEYCPALKPWLTRLADCLSDGLILFIDYGLPRRHYYHQQRSGGTLMCHYRQRAHPDPFVWPGLQDITAWVDFTAVAQAGVDAGLTLEGFTSQAAFLIGSGITQFVEESPSDRHRIEAAGQVRRLTMPGEMGEKFKVIGFGKGLRETLPGLTLQDLSGSL